MLQRCLVGWPNRGYGTDMSLCRVSGAYDSKRTSPGAIGMQDPGARSDTPNNSLGRVLWSILSKHLRKGEDWLRRGVRWGYKSSPIEAFRRRLSVVFQGPARHNQSDGWNLPLWMRESRQRDHSEAVISQGPMLTLVIHPMAPWWASISTKEGHLDHQTDNVQRC